MKGTVKRGHVYLADLGAAKGSVQAGVRPVIVLSNDSLNSNSTVSGIVPVTSRKKMNLPTHVNLDGVAFLPKESIALCEQYMTLDHLCFIRELGRLDVPHIKRIERAICINADIDTHRQISMPICRKCCEHLFTSSVIYIRRCDRYDRKTDWCAICGKNKGHEYYIGNRRFRFTEEHSVEFFLSAEEDEKAEAPDE